MITSKSRNKRETANFSKNSSMIIMTLIGVASLIPACGSNDTKFECTDELGCIEIGPNDPIKIGVLQDQTGGAASIGKSMINTVELAVADRGGKLLDHHIKLQVEDEGCTPQSGANAALRIVADRQVVGIIGPTCSDAAFPASKIMSEAGLVMISGSNIAPSLTGIGDEAGSDWHSGYFRTIQNGVYWGQIVARFSYQELGVRRGATINDDDPFSQALTQAFEKEFTALGGEIVLSTAITIGDPDFDPVLTAIQVADAEFVFSPIFLPEAGEIIVQAKQAGVLENVSFMLSGSAAVQNWIDIVGVSGIGVFLIIVDYTITPPIEAFNTRFEAAYGELLQNPVQAKTYDAAELLFSAIELVAVTEPDETLHIGRQALRDALYSTVNFDGITGQLSCNQYGDCSADSYQIIRLDDPAAGIEGLIENVIFSYDRPLELTSSP